MGEKLIVLIAEKLKKNHINQQPENTRNTAKLIAEQI